MACPQCGASASGQFCGNCGAAIHHGSPMDVAEAVDQPVPETSVPMSPDKPPVSASGPGPSSARFGI
jgi:hypothetical protein